MPMGRRASAGIYGCPTGPGSPDSPGSPSSMDLRQIPVRFTQVGENTVVRERGLSLRKTKTTSDTFTLTSPILQRGTRSREVYLPSGARWQHFYTNATHDGGQRVSVAAPLEHFPLFRRLPAV